MTDEEYIEAVTMAVLDAVAKIEPDGTGRGGYVRPHVFGGLVGAFAALVVEANPGMSLRDRKFVADEARKALLDQMKTLEEMRAAGEPLPWSGRVVKPN